MKTTHKKIKMFQWFAAAYRAAYRGSTLILLVSLLTMLFPNSAFATTTKIRQEINILDSYFYSPSGSYATSSEIVAITDTNYTSPVYYFEVVASTTSATNATVSLVDVTTGAIVKSITINGTSYSRYRSTTAFMPSASSTVGYKVKLGNESVGKGITAARIIILQSADPIENTETQIEIGNNEIYTSTATSTFASPKYWHYDSSKWDGLATFYAEVTYGSLGIAGATTTTTFSTGGNTTWTAPLLATIVDVAAWGGGGAGRTGDANGGGAGGGGGAFASSTLNITGGTVYNITVGAGGTSSGANGATSTFNTSSVVAGGGAGGGGVLTPVGNGGQASQSTGTVKNNGGNGGQGANGSGNNDQGGGGGGAGGPQGAGNVGANATASAGGNGGSGSAGFGGTAGAGGNGGACTGGGSTTVGGGGGGGGDNGLVGCAGGTYGGGGGGGEGGGGVGGDGAVAVSFKYGTAATTTITLQEDDGAFGTWTDKVQIVNQSEYAVSTSTRKRSIPFTPVTGRNYRIVFRNGHSDATQKIYNAKIVAEQNTGKWDASSGLYVFESMFIAAQENSSNGLSFSSDGTKAYVMGISNDTIYQYTLAPWDVSTGSYANKSLLVNTADTLETTPTDFSFSSDGTKVYIVGSATDKIWQFNLTTAWDISTGSYASKNLSVAAEEGVPTGLSFSSDGTKAYVVGTNNNTIRQYTLTTAWDISTGSYASKSLSVGAQENASNGLSFSSDGTKAYVVGTTNDTINQYTLTTAWDVSTGSYANKSVYISAQESAPTGLSFSSDGTKAYVVGTNNDAVYQYTLTTAWDISTGPYAAESMSVRAEETNSSSLSFSSDGTKAYVLGLISRKIWQYTLTTAWDISTGSYASKWLSVSTQEGSPEGLSFSSDGTKAYIVGSVQDTIYQYTLTTPWDISTGSYANKSLLVNTADTLEGSPSGLSFSSDGTKVYIVGYASDTIWQFNLTTAWDISTGSYASKSLSVAAQESTPQDLSFSSDGTKAYVLGWGQITIYQYTLTTAWDISTGSYASKWLSVRMNENSLYGLSLSSDGTKVYVVGTTNDTIYQYTLSTAWDIKTYLYAPKSLLVSAQAGSPSSLSFSSDGTKAYMIGATSDSIYQYTLTTPWDISTGSYANKSLLINTVDTPETTPNGLAFSSDGTKAYIVGSIQDTIYQFTLTTAWDVSTGSYASKLKSINSQEPTPTGLAFSPDGTKAYAIGSAGDGIDQFTLTTAWDISTASYADKTLIVGNQDTNPQDVFFSSDGTKAYVAGPTLDKVYQYTLTTAWDISTGSYANKTMSVGAEEVSAAGLSLSPDGTKVYVVGSTNDTIYQYALSRTFTPLLQPQYLLANTLASATGLRDFDTLYDSAEWVTPGNTYIHQIDSSTDTLDSAKLQSNVTATPADVANSTATGANLATSTAAGMTMPSGTEAERTIDVNVLDTPIYASRILVNVGVVPPSGPTLDNLHYRWRNDDGTESTATYANATNTALTSGIHTGDRRRLRFLVSNTGASTASNITYLLEHSSTTCSLWATVPTPTTLANEHWVMDPTTNVSDNAVSTDSTGITNPNGKTFVSGSIQTYGNQTAAHTLTNSQFTELEYSLRSTSNATVGTTYCFRLTNAGLTTNFTYTQQPSVILSPITKRPEYGGVHTEGGGSGSSKSGGSSGGGTTTPGEVPPPTPPPQGGGGQGGGGGDSGYLGDTKNYAAAITALSESLTRILEMINKMFVRD